MAAAGTRPRVLVIRGGAIGDFILTMPAIRLLRESIPGAYLEILGYKPIIELARAAGLADGTRHLEHASMARLFAPGATLDEELADWLRSFNLIVSYLFDPDGILRGNMERLGVKTFLDCPHHVIPGQGHAAEQLAKPLEKLAMFLEDPAPVISLLKNDGKTADSRLIAIHPGSGSLRKNWPVERWIAVGRDLASCFPKMTLGLITGEAENERGITSQMLAGWRGLDFTHWNQLPLVELAECIGTCQAFLGHDSGISHLAAACGVPCHLLFGPTDPGTWAPQNSKVRVYQEPSGDLQNLGLETGWRILEEFIKALPGPS